MCKYAHATEQKTATLKFKQLRVLLVLRVSKRVGKLRSDGDLHEIFCLVSRKRDTLEIMQEGIDVGCFCKNFRRLQKNPQKIVEYIQKYKGIELAKDKKS